MSKFPFVPCYKCKDNDSHIGYQLNENNILVECECHKKWHEDTMILIRAEKNNIWTDPKSIQYDIFKNHFGDKDSSQLHKLSGYVKNYNEDFRSASLYIQGAPNTQKTTVAQWMGLSIFKKGYIAYYERMHNFIQQLVPQGFNDFDKNKKYFDKLMAVDCLILDDAFDKAKASIRDFQLPYVESFLRERIQDKKKGIVFVSTTLIDRIKENNFTTSLQAFIEGEIGKHSTYVHLFDSTTHISTSSIFEEMKRA